MNSGFENTNNSSNKRKIALLLFRYSRFLTIVILLFIFSLSYFFLVKPKYIKMKNTSKELVEIKSDELQKLEIYLKQLKVFNESFKVVSNFDKEKINKIIPSENDYEDLVIDIEDIINDRGLVLNSVTIKSEEQETSSSRSRVSSKTVNISNLPRGVKAITLTLGISETNYITMKALLSDFEKKLRLMDVSSVSYTDDSEVNLVLSAYYYSL